MYSLFIRALYSTTIPSYLVFQYDVLLPSAHATVSVGVCIHVWQGACMCGSRWGGGHACMHVCDKGMHACACALAYGQARHDVYAEPAFHVPARDHLFVEDQDLLYVVHVPRPAEQKCACKALNNTE